MRNPSSILSKFVGAILVRWKNRGRGSFSYYISSQEGCGRSSVGFVKSRRIIEQPFPLVYDCSSPRKVKAFLVWFENRSANVFSEGPKSLSFFDKDLVYKLSQKYQPLIPTQRAQQKKEGKFNWWCLQEGIWLISLSWGYLGTGGWKGLKKKGEKATRMPPFYKNGEKTGCAYEKAPHV